MHVCENRMHIMVSHFDFLNMCHADGFVLISCSLQVRCSIMNFLISNIACDKSLNIVKSYSNALTEDGYLLTGCKKKRGGNGFHKQDDKRW